MNNEILSRPGAPGASATLPLRTLLAYGLPTFGASVPFFFVQMYLMNFATDVLAMAPAAVGVLLGLTKVWDAVSDPMVGVWSDRTRTRWGRRRPWMAASIPFMAVSFALTWNPPKDLDGLGLDIWLLFALLVFFTAITAWMIPHQALGAELSDHPHERTRIYGVRTAALMAGIFAGVGSMHAVTNAADPRTMASTIALAAACLMPFILIIPALGLRERPEFWGRSPAGGFRAFRDVMRNKHARLLLAVWLIDQLGLLTMGIIAPYVVLYILERPDLMGPFSVAYFVPALCSIPIWVWLSGKGGKRRTWIGSLVMSSTAYAALFTVGKGDEAILIPLLILAGTGSGCASSIGASLLASVIDDDEDQTGERKEGTYSAAWMFVTKVAGGIIALIVGVVLQWAEFVPGEVQAPTARLAISAVFALLPCFSFAAGALLLTRLTLQEVKAVDPRPPPT